MNIFVTLKKWQIFMSRVCHEILYNRYREPPDFCLAHNCNQLPTKYTTAQSTIKDIFENGFLWAVPKHRRSLERRMTRRMGFGKMLLPKNNIIVCEACGHFHPVHTVCGNCYEKVKIETSAMQDAVMEAWKLDPIDKDVVIVYENESKEDKQFQGKRLIELPKERPPWFSKNLLAKDSEVPRAKNQSVSDTNLKPQIHKID